MKLKLLVIFTFLLPSFGFAATTTEVKDEETGQFSAGAQKQGFYLAIGTGRIFFSGQDRSSFADGMSIAIKAGYDFLPALGAEFVFRTSGHESNIATVTSGVSPSFFGYQFLGLAKGAYPISKRLYAGGGLGGGIWFTKPNAKPNRGAANRGAFVGELTLEYFLRTKGLSIGLDPSVMGVVDFKSAIYQFSGYIRHSF